MNMHMGYGLFAGGQRMMGGAFGPGGLGLFRLVPVIGFLMITALIVGLVIWAIARKPTGSHPALATAVAAPQHDTAIAIARQRLAHGEIDAEQYATIVAALGAPSFSATHG